MNRRPRVALLVQQPQRRGAEVAAHQLGAALARRGCAAVRLYLYPDAGRVSLPLEGDDRVLGGRPGHPCERVPGVHPGLLRRLRRALAAFTPDVVQANGGRTLKYAAAARWLDAAGGWSLVYRNIGDPRRWAPGLRGAAYRALIAPRIDGVIGVSATTLTAALEHYRLDGVPAAAITSGIDPEALAAQQSPARVRESLGTPAHAPVLLYVGSLATEKRLDRLLAWAAGARRHHPHLHLWLIGEGPLRGRLEELARALGLGEAVTFAGARERVGDYLAAADLLLLASDTEGLPGVVLEAAFHGLPAVATAVGGVAECIEDGVTGRLVAPDEQGGIAAIVELLGHPGRRQALGAAARRRVDDHRIDRVAERHIAFYSRVVERRRARTAA